MRSAHGALPSWRRTSRKLLSGRLPVSSHRAASADLKLAAEHGQTICSPGELAQPSAVTLGAQLHREFRRKDDLSKLDIEAVVLQLLLGGGQSSTLRRGLIPSWLLRIREMLREQEQPRLTVAELSRCVGRHPSKSAASSIIILVAPSANTCGESALLARNRSCRAATSILPRSRWLAGFRIKAISLTRSVNLQACRRAATVCRFAAGDRPGICASRVPGCTMDLTRAHMGEHWQRLQEIFDEIRALDDDSRRAILDQKCNGDERLRGEALRLLQAYDDERAANVQANASQEGRRFGAWETIELLARGGMGEVWLAKRADGQHEQRAALKILSPYLAAPDSLDRFRHERQILAGLEHPNIARLLDGGRAPAAVPTS